MVPIMSSVTLTAAVRSNLLALQDTTANQATTQQRLATGKKVNSALDNPTNYFTAAALSARAGQLINLLDSMTNGINTLKAADNGLTSITTTLQSMQATVTQARQDASWQSTSYGLDTAAIGTAQVKNIGFSGGAVGATAVNIALNTTGITAATVTASADYVAPIAASGPVATTGVDFANLDISNGNETYAFTVSKNGGAAVNVQLAAADGSLGSIWAPEAVTGINADLAAGGSTIRVRTVSGWSRLQFYDTDAANTGTAATITVSDITKGGTTPTGTLGWEGGTLSGQGADAVSRIVTIGDGTTTATATLTTANAATAAAARTAIQAAIDATALVGTITVGGSANRINLTGLADGSNSITVGGADVDNVFGAGRTVTPGNTGGGAGAVKTVDQLVSDINGTAALAGKVKASNNAGQLQITDLSTSVLTITGVSASTGKVDGSGGTATVAANTTRQNLVVQFNQLKDQLDKTASDSSFNGINLLAGDQLRLYFNENSTSYINIQSTNAAGINSSTLGVNAGTSAEFQSNTLLDTRLQSLQTAVTTVASQASAFGNNLSIVQNRQTFTNNMVNTLQTGSDGLTLADGNLEGANMLALQTRQQLSIQALSLASQANQAVLRLFG